MSQAQRKHDLAQVNVLTFPAAVVRHRDEEQRSTARGRDARLGPTEPALALAKLGRWSLLRRLNLSIQYLTILDQMHRRRFAYGGLSASCFRLGLHTTAVLEAAPVAATPELITDDLFCSAIFLSALLKPENSRPLPADLHHILQKAHHPDERMAYATAALFAEDLRHFVAGQPVSARPASWLQRAMRLIQRPLEAF